MTVPRRRVFAVAVVLLGAIACGRGPEPAAPPAGGMLETEARKLIATYDAAWVRKDWAAVDKILAPEYVYFSSKGRVSDRAWAKTMMESPAYRLDTSRRDEIVAHRSGSTVVVGSRWRGSGTYDGKPFTDDQRCSVVVAFADGEGRVLAEHCTAIVPE